MTAADTAADAFDRLPDAVTDVFGADATATHAYDLLTVDVPAASWITALETARDALGCTYFDWLSAVDEPGTGFRVCAHVAALGEGRVRRLLVRTTVPHEAPVLPSAIGVYAGAAWHERETHEMFGVGFDGHPHLVPLLLPEAFEGHPLRKDFVLAARVAKAWPGAKEPGESEHGGPKRRTMLPPGVPDPNEWGPLKGQLPPAPARPARGARAAGAAGERPARRARSVSEGSAAQRSAAAPDAASDASGVASGAPGTAPDASAGGVETPRAARPRRTRSASQGSASQTPGPTATPEAGAASDASAEAPRAKGAAGSADAPWHDARPAFDTKPEPAAEPERTAPEQAAPEPEAAVPEPEQAAPEPEPAAPEPEQTAPAPRTDSTDDSGSSTDSGGTDDSGSSGGSEGSDSSDSSDSAGRTDSADTDNTRTDNTDRTDSADGPDRRPDHPDRPAGGDTA
ncbi:NADH-quinone oxidoreductase subunit C [Streptomyces sp. NPDC002913]